MLAPCCKKNELPSLTGMSDDGELPIGLLDLKLGSCWRDAQGVIIGGISDHDGSRVRTLQRSIKEYQKESDTSVWRCIQEMSSSIKAQVLVKSIIEDLESLFPRQIIYLTAFSHVDPVSLFFSSFPLFVPPFPPLLLHNSLDLRLDLPFRFSFSLYNFSVCFLRSLGSHPWVSGSSFACYRPRTFTCHIFPTHHGFCQECSLLHLPSDPVEVNYPMVGVSLGPGKLAFASRVRLNIVILIGRFGTTRRTSEMTKTTPRRRRNASNSWT